MTYYILDIESGAPLERDGERLLYADGREAAEAAKAAHAETGRKHQPRRLVEDAAWREREARRLASGEYLPLPIGAYLQEILTACYPDHFAHLARKRAGYVAYTRDAAAGAADRQTVVPVQTYVKRFLSPPNYDAARCEFDAAIERNSQAHRDAVAIARRTFEAGLFAATARYSALQAAGELTQATVEYDAAYREHDAKRIAAQNAATAARDAADRAAEDAYRAATGLAHRYFPHDHNPLLTRAVLAFVEQEVKFASTPDEIEGVYTNYADNIEPVARSCMRGRTWDWGCHPVRVYGAGDLAVAYLTNAAGETTHRALCWPEKKIYSRMYAADDVLHKMLAQLGYAKSRYYGAANPTLAGARLLAIPADCAGDNYVMPYIDEAIDVELRDSGDELYFVLSEGGGLYSTRETNGTTSEPSETDDEEDEDTFLCERCDNHTHNDEATRVYVNRRDVESWCEDCVASGAFRCDYSGEMYADDGVSSVEMADGAVWAEFHFSHYGFVSDHSGDNFAASNRRDVYSGDPDVVEPEHWSIAEARADAVRIADVWYTPAYAETLRNETPSSESEAA